MSINFSSKILVVGDVIIDEYVMGVVSRISPEAPIPVLRVENTEYRLGGSANVALNIASVGIKVGLIGMIGNDQLGLKVRELLLQNCIDDLLVSKSDTSTILKQRVVSKGQQIVRIDYEPSEHYNASEEVISEFLKHISNYDVVIFSDYNKGVLNEVEGLIAICRQQNKFCLVDPKKLNIAYYRGANLLKPNLQEFTAMLRCSSKMEILHENMEKASLENQIDQIVVTMGAEGLVFREKNGNFGYSSASSKSVYDVSGAGDTVCAIMAVAIASGWEIKNAAELANRAASVVVEKFGTATLSAEEFHDIIELVQNVDETKEDIAQYDIESLLPEISGKKCVFTNGCFDILHVGHIEYLQASRKLGEVLIVGVNSDRSVKRLKGSNRPINDCDTRLKMLKALECVDYAIPFDDDTPQRLIEKLQPDVLTKGGDYKPTEVVGYEFMKKIGKKVKIIPFIRGYSTTEIIKSLKNNK